MAKAQKRTSKQTAVQSYGHWGLSRQQIDEGIIGLLGKGPQPRKELQAAFGGQGSSPARVVNSIRRLLRDKRIARCEEGYRLTTAKPKRAKPKTQA